MSNYLISFLIAYAAVGVLRTLRLIYRIGHWDIGDPWLPAWAAYPIAIILWPVMLITEWRNRRALKRMHHKRPSEYGKFKSAAK